jgi:hypothetical protein
MNTTSNGGEIIVSRLAGDKSLERSGHTRHLSQIHEGHEGGTKGTKGELYGFCSQPPGATILSGTPPGGGLT